MASQKLNRKRISLYLLAGFYLFAGVNHFIHPTFYYPLIPDYLPWKEFINQASGIVEIVLSLAVLWPKTRKAAALSIILMLIAFIPSHVHFIVIGGCITDGLCAPLWVGWLRLLLVHPLLIWWAWSVRK